VMQVGKAWRSYPFPCFDFEFLINQFITVLMLYPFLSPFPSGCTLVLFLINYYVQIFQCNVLYFFS
jgi:hypothetical protein